MRPRRARQAHRSAELEGEAVEPIVVIELEKRVTLGSARVVDHDVDAAKVSRGEIGKLGGAFGKAQIERNRRRDAPVTFNLVDSGFESADGAGAQHGLRAFFRQAYGDGASDASAGAGDDPYFAGEVRHYCCAF